MTVSWAETIDNHKFELISGSYALQEPSIAVPVSVAESLDSQSIGDYVKGLIRHAWRAEAFETAYHVLDYAKHGEGSRNRLDQENIDFLGDRIGRLRQFSGEHQSIDDAIAAVDRFLEREKQRRAKQEEARTHARRVRSQMQADYSNTFVKLGRRDGFRCAICQSSDPDLQIDHVIPVSKGGANDLDNLQLLCKSCNRQKWDSIKS